MNGLGQPGRMKYIAAIAFSATRYRPVADRRSGRPFSCPSDEICKDFCFSTLPPDQSMKGCLWFGSRSRLLWGPPFALVLSVWLRMCRMHGSAPATVLPITATLSKHQTQRGPRDTRSALQPPCLFPKSANNEDLIAPQNGSRCALFKNHSRCA
jgi:hypothetical protein